MTVVSAVADGANIPAFTPSPVALPEIPTLERWVTDFGAIANDGLDDSAAIQRALDAVNGQGGGTLRFPRGRFDVSIDPALRRALTIYPRMRWRGDVGAVVRLADAQPIYESILAPATYPTRLDDIEFVGLTFDANGLANPVRDPQETNGDAQTDRPTLRYVIRSFVGARARIANSTFINNDNGNTVSFNGTGISDVTIESSQFLAVGGALIDHDHSTIYFDGKRLRLVNNEFRGRNGAGTLGARTAFELHGDDVEASDNLVVGFLQGTNVVGRVSDPARHLVQRNQFVDVGVGINIWPLADGLIGPAFETLELRDNTINVDADRWWSSPATVVNHLSGIHFESDIARAPVARMVVEDNVITFDSFAGKTASADRYSVGIGIRGVEDVLRVSSLSIQRNTVRNAIGPCVLIAAIVGVKNFSRVKDNVLTDCGRSEHLEGEGELLRSAIVIGGRTSQLTISGNQMHSTGASPLTRVGILTASTCVGICTAAGNRSEGIPTPLQNLGTGW